jgi:hypothetical protein
MQQNRLARSKIVKWCQYGRFRNAHAHRFFGGKLGATINLRQVRENEAEKQAALSSVGSNRHYAIA